MNILVFDIETIPDANLGRKLYDLAPDTSDDDVIELMLAKRREKTDGASDFLPLHMHKVVAISAVLRSQQHIKVWSLGDESSGEKEIIQRFFDGIEKYTPTLVSWNGSGFDLPVLHYRSLIHGVVASRYWDVGENDREFKWNNYINRFQYRHSDLMDILAGFQGRGAIPLDQAAIMLGFPGKMGMSGGSVYESYKNGELKKIRDYCETDVLNTYLVYLRWLMIRGDLIESEYEREITLCREHLSQQNLAHFNEFLSHWQV